MKLWAGRSEEETAALADAFNSSIAFDSRMAKQDITGSMAHAAMLGAKGILTPAEAAGLIDGLQGVLDDLESGALAVDLACGEKPGPREIDFLQERRILFCEVAEREPAAFPEIVSECEPPARDGP